MASEGFFKTPNDITTLAPRVGFAAAWVYVLLLRHADSNRQCWPTQEMLATESGLSVMTVRRAIEKLEAEGLISAERTGRANMFTVNNLIVLTEQSDAHHRTIIGEVNNLIVLTEQSDCSVRTIRGVPPSSPPSLLPPDPHSLFPPIIPPTREEDTRKRAKKESCAEPADFVAFYREYPRKEARPKACAAWQKLKPDAETTQKIMAALSRAVLEWKRRDAEFIPHPATWLNQRRWEDEGVPDGFSNPPARNGHSPPPPKTPEERSRGNRDFLERMAKERGYG